MARRQRNVRTARRGGQWLRWMFNGPQGSGKTWSALKLATALADHEGRPGKILVVDTEVTGPDAYSSELYSGGKPYDFEVWGWPAPYDPDELAEVIMEEARNFAVIVIDSGSPFWEHTGGIIPHRDEAAQKRFGGNEWAAWSEVRPIQERFVRAMNQCACHLIFCTRSKVAWGGSAARPIAVGTNAKQDPDIEYYFTVSAGILKPTSSWVIRKTRWDGVVDDEVFAPGEEQDEMIPRLIEWLDTAAPSVSVLTQREAAEIRAEVAAIDSDQLRGRVKVEFKKVFGEVDEIPEARFGEAKKFIADMVKGRVPDRSPRGDAVPEGEPFLDEEFREPLDERAAKKAPAKKAAARKKAPAKKATKPRESQPVSSQGERPEESATDTHPENGAAPGADTGVHPDEHIRGQIVARLAAVTGDRAEAGKTALEENGWWPITKIPAAELTAAELTMKLALSK